MITLASIIDRFESDYQRQYSSGSLPSHAHALAALQAYRRQPLEHRAKQPLHKQDVACNRLDQADRQRFNVERLADGASQ